MSDTGRIDARAAVQELLETRYRGAKAIFMGGSCAHGTETAHSDLDLIALFERVQPVREAYFYKGWPVDASTGDQATLMHAIAAAPQRGDCTVPMLIFDSVVVPERSEVTDALQARAKAVIDAGPVAMTPREQQQQRFSITYLRTKLLGPRADEDVLSLGAMLHVKLGQFYLRANRKWAGTPTSLATRLRDEDPALTRRMYEAFHLLFSRLDSAPVISLVEELLAPHGGLLFDGYRDLASAPQPGARMRRPG